MRVQWEKRGNAYFAYARYSFYDPQDKKTKTVNKYLGRTISSAISNFTEFANIEKLDKEYITTVVLYLEKKGKQFNVKYNNELINETDFITKFYPEFLELKINFLTANSSLKRKDTAEKLSMFWENLLCYLKSINGNK